MCIVSKPVQEMANTKLFIAKDTFGKRQLVVYANKVKNNNRKNAMILPVPNPHTLKFDNLEKYSEFFSHCSSCFFDKETTLSFSNNYSSDTRSRSLNVFSVGSYDVSIALSYDELKNIDTNVFEMDQSCLKTLKNYDMPVFGFIICQLKSGDHKYHPLAYSHDIINGQVFIPTKHYHGHFDEKYVDDWDHEIYLYNIDKSRIPKGFNFNLDRFEWFIKEDRISRKFFDFEFGKLDSFIKFQVKGRNINEDIIVDERQISVLSY